MFGTKIRDYNALIYGTPTQICKGHAVFVQSDSGMYGAKVIGIAANHYRVQTYYSTGLPYRHNVSKDAVSLQDGQY